MAASRRSVSSLGGSARTADRGGPARRKIAATTQDERRGLVIGPERPLPLSESKPSPEWVPAVRVVAIVSLLCADGEAGPYPSANHVFRLRVRGDENTAAWSRI